MTRQDYIPWMAVIIWMMIIFNLSDQVAEQSNELSTGITEIVVNTVEKVVPNIQLDVKNFNGIIRKNAHFIAYLILGILLMYALRRKGIRSTWITFAIGGLYAISDEIHQLYVPGRSAELRDVFIDSIGVVSGIMIYLLLRRIRLRL